jgi:hypothetical protein
MIDTLTLLRDEEAAGSNPATPTRFHQLTQLTALVASFGSLAAVSVSDFCSGLGAGADLDRSRVRLSRDVPAPLVLQRHVERRGYGSGEIGRDSVKRPPGDDAKRLGRAIVSCIRKITNPLSGAEVEIPGRILVSCR